MTFRNPDNNLEYYHKGNDIYGTNIDGMKEFFLPNCFIPDHIGERTLEYCEKYYIKIK